MRIHIVAGRLSTARLLALALLALAATTSRAADHTPPTAPTGLTATVISAYQINLSWNASTDNVGVVNYLVERCQGAGCSFVQIGPSSSTSYSDTTVAPATTYAYRVRAQDAAGNLSSYSNVVSVSTPNVPSAPTGLTARAVSSSQIDLSWTASTGGVVATGYYVERCATAYWYCLYPTNFQRIATVTGTTFSDTGLPAATGFLYHVRAFDSGGNLSPYSDAVEAMTFNAPFAQILYYIHPDHLNTPRLIADSTGTTVWRWDQGEPFGNDVPNSNPSGAVAFDFPLRFPGQYFDRETNLKYNFFRDYDAGIGRYVESDPLGLVAGLNTYAYARTSPVKYRDEYGLASQEIDCKKFGFPM